MTPVAWDPSDGVLTHRCVRRRGKFTKAIRHTNLAVQWAHIAEQDEAWSDIPCSDVAIASQCRLRLVRPHRRAHRIDIPESERYPAGERGSRGNLWREILGMIEAGTASSPDNGLADEVIRRELEGGRQVYLHNLTSRLLQRMTVLALGPRLDGGFPTTVHGFRPRRSPVTALYAARALYRRGFEHATSGDIRRFFPSCDVDVVMAAVEAEGPYVAPTLLNLVRWQLSPPVLGDALGDWSGPLGHLLTGSVLAPLMANCVAAQVLDRPFDRVFGDDAKLLRFADDFVILARSRALAEEAREAVAAMLDAAGLELHPDKGRADAVDLHRDELEWLGKVIRRGEISTHEATVRRHVSRVCASSPNTPAAQQAAIRLADDLIFDSWARISAHTESLRLRAPQHAHLIEQTARNRRKKRIKRLNELAQAHGYEANKSSAHRRP